MKSADGGANANAIDKNYFNFNGITEQGSLLWPVELVTRQWAEGPSVEGDQHLCADFNIIKIIYQPNALGQIINDIDFWNGH